MTKIVYKAVNSLILNVCGSDYINESIFMGFNNVNLPKDNLFCIINELYSVPMEAIMLKSSHPNTENKTNTTLYQQVNVVKMQVDFYSNVSSNIANTNSFNLSIALQSPYATDFLLKKYDITVESAESPQNFSEKFDRNSYIQRYSVNFGLFVKEELNIINEAFNATRQEIVKLN